MPEDAMSREKSTRGERSSSGIQAMSENVPEDSVSQHQVAAEEPVAHPNEKAETGDDHKYPGRMSLTAIMVALNLAIFLVALDRSIIATAIPRITDDFHALNDIGWYGSSYLVTGCAFQLIYGRFYTFYTPKWVFLSAIAVFEVGSAVCGAAPTSTAFIVGRAIAGLGSCGIFTGSIVLIVDVVPLQQRPMMTGFMGSIFGVSNVIAPLIGGAFTDRVTWRWCFYINLPIGAAAVIIIMFLLKASPPPHQSTASTFRERASQFDPLGAFFFLPAMVCLILALQWGGTKYPWSNGRIIALFVLFGVLMIAFVAVQVWKRETASVPPRIIKVRSIAAGVFYSLTLGGSMMVIVYYLPIWFQAIKGVSVVKSGVMNLPLVLSLVIAGILAGIGVSRIGYAVPFMYASAILMSIGAGLLTTFTVSTGHAKWIGYQVIYGFGLGLGMQRASVAAQTELERKDVPTGSALMMLSQSLGGAIFLAVAQTVFTNGLISNLQGAVPGYDGKSLAHVVEGAGATTLRQLVGGQDLPAVLVAYNTAVRNTFILGLALSCATIIGAIFAKWTSVKSPPQKKGDGPGLKGNEA
ncbi:major facilitator superfamily domain-containing protein [Aspergillus novoparasiticus]|uniref:Major facilitator superfamily domain-containing protein n=1 Tax=Aspergillus novoparasiticus TaxID=986946 RepID=A0A5N6ELQ7_9EURO|nr:major facilitator superfamily domain-containing protein [Aspergillus novoparasiticus]